PVLYRNLSIKEKLKSESYVKYNSGFTLDEKDKRESTGTVMSLTRAVQFETRPLSEQTTSSPVTIDKNYSLESTSNNRKSRVAFERYIAGLDKKSGR
ncbi:MAG: hypothetical protein IKX05_00105, partial [Bacteroidales bacterium]|nr:hypothetical protein [Bacteroidales bacterium]